MNTFPLPSILFAARKGGGGSHGKVFLFFAARKDRSANLLAGVSFFGSPEKSERISLFFVVSLNLSLWTLEFAERILGNILLGGVLWFEGSEKIKLDSGCRYLFFVSKSKTKYGFSKSSSKKSLLLRRLIFAWSTYALLGKKQYLHLKPFF